MRRGHHKTGLNYNQRHHLTKMMSIITLVCLLVQTILSPISQYVYAAGNVLGISLSTSTVNETEVLVATLIDTGEDSNGPLSFTVPDGLTISGIVAGQENIEAISNGNQTLQFNWTENSNKVVQVQLQAQKAGDYTATFSSSDSTVSASVTVVAPVTEEVEDKGEQNQPETAATEEESSDDEEGDSDESRGKVETFTLDREEEGSDDNISTYATGTFDHIDIMTTGSFTYVVDGKETTVSINFDQATINDVKIYNAAGDHLELTPVLQNSTTQGYKKEWRFSGEFNKSEIYTVEFTFDAVIGDETVTFEFEQQYKYDWDTNICPGSDSWGNKGIDIAIKGEDLTNHFTSGMIIKKIVSSEEKTLNSTFTFNVYSGEKLVKTVDLTTENGAKSLTIGGLEPGEYTVVEVNPTKSLEGYKLISVKAGNNTYSISDDSTYQTKVTVASGNNATVTFENVYEQEKPSIKVEKLIVKKEAVNGEYVFAPGETVEYEIKVTNDGNVDLTNIELSDQFFRDNKLTDLTINGYDGAFDLKAGQNKTFSATFVVPENEVGGTVYKNTATVKVDNLEKSDDVEFTVESQPALEVTKTVDQNKVKPGNKVTYTITVKNTGNTALKNVTLTDVMKQNNVVMDQQLVLMDGEIQYKGDSFSLSIGESKTFTADYKVPDKTKVDTVFYNVATATSGNLTSSDDATVTVDNDPRLAVEKSVNKNEAKPGETVTYTYKVTNTGNSDLQVTLSDVFSKDGTKLPDNEQLVLKDATGKVYNGEVFTLEYNKEVVFTAEYTIPINTKVNTQFYNVVTAETDTLKVIDHETVKVADDPSLTVDKSVDKKVAKPGETVTYTYTVTNTGNSDLQVTLDDMFSQGEKELDDLVIRDEKGEVYEGGEFDLGYQEEVTFTATYTIPDHTKEGTTFNNVVTVKSGELTVTDNETVTVDKDPALSVDKSVDKNVVKPGEKVVYTYKVTNLGNSDLEVTLDDVISENNQVMDEQLVLKNTDGSVYDGGTFTLAYEETVTFTAEFTIPENTKVDTVFHNAVTVTSGDIEKTDEENVTVANDPGLEVEKSVNKNEALPGETVTYTYTVTNTGNSDLEVTLADVFSENGTEMDKQLVLKDAEGNNYDGKAFKLAYEETATFTAEYKIPENTKVDTVFHNVVTVTSGDLIDTDEENVTVLNKPGLEVEKSVNKNEAKPGETVTYTYTVTNTGNSDLEVTLFDVFSKDGTVLDEQLTLTDAEGNVYNGEVFTLAYEKSATFTAGYKIPENTKVDTVFQNKVTVKSGDLTDTDKEDVTVLNDPGLSVEKSVDKNEALPGETVTYTYTVTNTGNSDLEVTLADVFSKNGKEMDDLVLKDAEGNMYEGKAFTLAYEGTKTFTAEYKIPENTKVDTVFSNVVTVSSGELTDTDAEDVTVLNNPGLDVEKFVNKNEAKPGETVTYTYAVTNTGNSDLEVTLADVFRENGTEMDKQLVLKDVEGNNYDGKAFKLAYEETVTFTAEYKIPENTKVDTIFHNEVTVKSGELTDTDAEDVTVLNDPSLSVEKSVDKNEAKPGETVTYTYTVTNTGNSDLEVTLADVFSENGIVLEEQLVLTDAEGNVYNGEAFTLAYEDTAIFIAEYTIPENTKAGTEFHNAVIVNSGNIEESDEETVTVAEDPGMTVDKSVDKNVAKPGETVKYTYTVTNTGNSDLKVTLTDVFSKNGKELEEQLVIYDEQGEIYDGAAFDLNYQDAVTFTAEYTIPANTKVDTEFNNVVTATSGDLVATDDETVTVDNNPGLMVDKKVDRNVAKPGETVTYTYTVTNIGNSDLEVMLSDVFSQDDLEITEQLVLKDQGGNVYNGEAFVLAYEGTVTFTAEYTIPANVKAETQFKNAVTVTSGDLVATDEETVTVDRDPSMTVEKTADRNIAKPGETVTYTITVSNTGNTDLNVTLSDVFSENGKVMEEQLVLKDAEGNEYKGEAFTLAYEETATFTAEYTIPEDAKANTVYQNVVTAADEDVVITDDEEVTVDEVPSLKVEKTADKTQYLPGETVTYTIKVTNDGNVDLKGITLNDVFSKNNAVADQQLAVEGYEGPFDLAIDETVSFTSKFVIPEDALADTTYKNVVTTTTGDVLGEDEVVIVVDPTYAFTIEKTADKTEASVGETVTYTIVVTNTGNKALTNIHVKDDMIGLDTVVDQLDVDEVKTFTGAYVVTAEDIGDMENIVTASVEVDGETITHEASVIVKVSALDAVAVEETPTTNPQTGDTTINTLLILFVFVLAGSGLYAYKRKYRG